MVSRNCTRVAARTIATSWSFSDLASMAKAAVRPLAAQVQVLLKRFQGLQWRLQTTVAVGRKLF